MTTVIAQTFTDALAKLTNDEQKQAKLTAFDLQTNPENPGLQYHRIDNSKDKNFWSVRVNRDLRIIVHKMAGKSGTTTMLAYVDHHDDAYDWAERRRIDVHPRTGSMQIVEVRERFEELVAPAPDLFIHADQTDSKPVLAGLRPDEILDIGVPEDWVSDLLSANEARFLSLYNHIPAEAAEKLLVYATDGILPADQSTPQDRDTPISDPAEAYHHPDAMRRFRVLENVEELEQALEFPWEKWMLYLHPAQAKVVHTHFQGPARVAGSAGTGKTVVALHRAGHVLRDNSTAKLLLTTFSSQLSAALKRKLWQLVDDNSLRSRATILSYDDLAKQMFTLTQGFEPRLLRPSDIDAAIAAALGMADSGEFTAKFVSSEWEHVVDAWQLTSLDEYENVPRIGRRQRLGKSQRARLWPIFEAMLKSFKAQQRMSIAQVKSAVSAHYSSDRTSAFSHIIVDEAQDLGVADLKMLAALSNGGVDNLFFAGDLGQRIFQEPFSWMGLGVDIRGRSKTLNVNYRTSHQIRSKLDLLLPEVMRDVDGIEDQRTGTISIFNGPQPKIQTFSDGDQEVLFAKAEIEEWISNGIAASEIGLFARTDKELVGVKKMLNDIGIHFVDLIKTSDAAFEFDAKKLNVGTMHLAKGLEFRAVVVLGCNDDVLPLEERTLTARDVDELNSIIETERHLLYVAATRAREHLVISAVEPTSEFLADLK